MVASTSAKNMKVEKDTDSNILGPKSVLVNMPICPSRGVARTVRHQPPEVVKIELLGIKEPILLNISRYRSQTTGTNGSVAT